MINKLSVHTKYRFYIIVILIGYNKLLTCLFLCYMPYFICTSYIYNWQLLAVTKKKRTVRVLSSHYAWGPGKDRTARIYCMQSYLAFWKWLFSRFELMTSWWHDNILSIMPQDTLSITYSYFLNTNKFDGVKKLFTVSAQKLNFLFQSPHYKIGG